MSKRIKPKEQTDKLNEARFEFLKRNPKKLDELKKLYIQNEEKRRRVVLNAAGDNPKLQAAWDFFLADTFTDAEFKDRITEIETGPAANVGPHVSRFIMAREYDIMLHGGKGVNDMTEKEFNEAYLEYLCKHAREIFAELTNGQPVWHMLLGVDMSRTKEAILAEVAELITQRQNRAGLGLEDIRQERLKWLSIVDELLAVWDVWAAYEQKQCFHLIARKMKKPESTIKARWRLAYRLIHGEEFTKEKATDDAIQLCAKCAEQKKCYKIKDGEMEFHPCAAYVKWAGRDYSREKYFENMEILEG